MLKVNDILYTKDGRETGNAIVVEVLHSYRGAYYVAITDYGNKIVLNEQEAEKLFYTEQREKQGYEPPHKHAVQ